MNPEKLDAALARLSERLKTSRREYIEALLALVFYVEEQARSGDVVARQLAEEVERKRDRMVTETLAAADVLI
jgi:hypothetical protein